MKTILTLIIAIFSLSSTVNSEESQKLMLDYEKLVLLDAENLAEQGILDAYKGLESELSKYVTNLAKLKGKLDSTNSSYEVAAQGETFKIYGQGMKEGEGQSWGRATYAFFRIVNLQLENSDTKFYAFNGGNDLGGMFLTKQQYVAALKNISSKTDRPYIPKLSHPWYGQEN